MIVKTLEVGPLMTNCYIIADETTKEAAIFDPGDDSKNIIAEIKNENLTVKYIFNTHGHWDHVGANTAVKEATGVDILIHKKDAYMLGKAEESALMWGMISNNSETSLFMKEGDEFKLGGIIFKIITLGGHSPGGVGFVFEAKDKISKETETFVICGDTLFAGSIGRSDFEGGNLEDLLNNIRKKLFSLPDNTIVLPGHGPHTKIGHEKRTNPFLRTR